MNREFRQIGLEGRPFENELIIDAHMHIGDYHNFLIPNTDIPHLIEEARRLSFSRLYGSSLLAIQSDATAGNSNALQAQETYPGFFHPYLVVKPNYPEETDQILKSAQAKRIRQFKIHDDGNLLPYDDDHYRPLYEFAQAKRSIVLVHTYGKLHVIPIMKIAGEYPDMRIILAHSGITDEEIYIEAARKHPNVYLDLTSSLAWYGLIERLVYRIGDERLLFGTDMPFMSPHQQMGRILFAKISDEAKRRIFGLNADALFAQ